jgi:proteasome lid subunit RPN8/RPN11
MKKNGKSRGPAVVMEAEVARRIRQHGRSSMKAEVCGVLIGREEGNSTFVDACIAGDNAAQGGAHVTFTQDTWEHIYAVKDEKYPDDRIVGWYHSHPGFGVFLSDHDEFIQQNFFSSPRQVAWVYDPHSDEEGCFGWENKRIAKLDDVRLNFDLPVGEVKDSGTEDDHPRVKLAVARGDDSERGWLEWGLTISTYLFVFVIGVALTLFLFPPKTFILTPGGLVEVRLSRDSSGNLVIEYGGDKIDNRSPSQSPNQAPSHDAPPQQGGQNAGK